MSFAKRRASLAKQQEASKARRAKMKAWNKKKRKRMRDRAAWIRSIKWAVKNWATWDDDEIPTHAWVYHRERIEAERRGEEWELPRQMPSSWRSH